MKEQLLTEDQLEQALATLDVAWSAIPGQGLVRVFETGSFRAGVELIARVAKVAERMDHHPDVNLTSDEVEITLVSHEQGGVTQKDIDMAVAIDQL